MASSLRNGVQGEQSPGWLNIQPRAPVAYSTQKSCERAFDGKSAQHLVGTGAPDLNVPVRPAQCEALPIRAQGETNRLRFLRQLPTGSYGKSLFVGGADGPAAEDEKPDQDGHPHTREPRPEPGSGTELRWDSWLFSYQEGASL